MIGSPAGMKTLVVAQSAGGRVKVLDIAAAVKDDFLYSPGLQIDDPNSKQILDELNNAAPNLGLNVKNATASARELWFWATVGLVMQAAAVAIPGVATYFWRWEKAGLPVPPYGYPCFLIGTLMVIAGVAACGHVIEGITTEHRFTATPDVKRVVRLQRACTVGDQHFSSCAIYNSQGDLDIRTSRLNKERDYRSVTDICDLSGPCNCNTKSSSYQCFGRYCHRHRRLWIYYSIYRLSGTPLVRNHYSTRRHASNDMHSSIREVGPCNQP